MKKILVLNDFVSWGRIAGSQVDTILTYKGLDVMFVPTALISNMFYMGQTAKLDTSSYMEETLKKWSKSDIVFDAIFIGYVTDYKQKNIITDFLENLSYKPLVVHDPIMADNGSLYKGLDPKIIDIHRDIGELSDILIPNFTEASLLADKKNSKVNELIEILSKGEKKVIITSVKTEDTPMILSYNGKEIEEIPYEHIDESFAGTGDIFDGIFLANYLESGHLKEAIVKTKDSISNILRKKIIDDPKNHDIRIESYLNLI